MTDSKVEFSEYKGNSTIGLPTENGKWIFWFGVHKAKAILKHIKDIEQFVKEKGEGD